jgi:hypothetical protein
LADSEAQPSLLAPAPIHAVPRQEVQ